MSDFDNIHKPAFAGQFYPASTEALQHDVMKYLCVSEAEIAVPGTVRAFVVPHAGYQYSGATAGKAYSLLEGAREDIKRVVLLAPSHYICMHGVSVGNYESYSTPLGRIKVDVNACRELLEADALFRGREDAHRHEHSLEVQLPFLQQLLPDFQVVPIVCGNLTKDDIVRLSKALRNKLFDRETLWVTSSDFTHFGASFGYVPFQQNIPERLRELDQRAINFILDLDFTGFVDFVEETGATICGRFPIALLLAVLNENPEQLQGELVEYTTSGELTGDYTHCVSYASIVFFEKSEAEVEEVQAATDMLSEADKKMLLKEARASIAERLGLKEGRLAEDDNLSPVLHKPGACFVSLHIDGELRGCVGSLESEEPLYQNVRRNACNAAFGDFRFAPLSAAEYSQIEIEISVLTPARQIESLNEFNVGQHGIILQKGLHRAVFLPQVASEHGWDRETTLSHLAVKAGLSADDWRRDSKFYVFEAIVFGESEIL